MTIGDRSGRFFFVKISDTVGGHRRLTLRENIITKSTRHTPHVARKPVEFIGDVERNRLSVLIFTQHIAAAAVVVVVVVAMICFVCSNLIERQQRLTN